MARLIPARGTLDKDPCSRERTFKSHSIPASPFFKSDVQLAVKSRKAGQKVRDQIDHIAHSLPTRAFAAFNIKRTGRPHDIDVHGKSPRTCAGFSNSVTKTEPSSRKCCAGGEEEMVQTNMAERILRTEFTQ